MYAMYIKYIEAHIIHTHTQDVIMKTGVMRTNDLDIELYNNTMKRTLTYCNILKK